MRMSTFEGTSIYFFSFVKFDRHKNELSHMHSCSLCVREVDLSEAGGSILTHMYIYRKILGEGIIFSVGITMIAVGIILLYIAALTFCMYSLY